MVKSKFQILRHCEIKIITRRLDNNEISVYYVGTFLLYN